MSKSESARVSSVFDEALERLAHPDAIGDGFFLAAAEALSKALNVGWAAVGELRRETQSISLLVLCRNGAPQPLFEYPLEGAPCSRVYDQKSGSPHWFIGDRVADAFPQVSTFAQGGVRSYRGELFFSEDGERLGHVFVMDDRPADDDPAARAFFRIIAQRAGAELRQRRLRERLELSETRFRDFTEVASEWWWETDAEGRFSFFSPTFARAAGVDPAQLLGRTRRELLDADADELTDAHFTREDWDRHLARVGAREPYKNLVHPRRAPHGAMRQFMISGKPIYDGTGAFLGYRHVGVDVTLRIAATLALEEQRESLRSAVAEADAANRSKSIFLANVSHELRTPLNAILGFSEALLSGALGRLDDGSAPYVRDIHASGRHLLDLISDVLDISRIEAGELAVREDEFDLDRLCADCLDMTAIRAQNAGVAPTLGRQPPTATRIVGDKRALRQILLNLLSNAVKFTPSGGTIVVDLEVDRAHGIAISVTDSGVGVPPSEREHIFTPFSRGGSPLLRGAGGSGLGLAIVRSLVTAHGGAVCVEDAPTGGARFVVTLPAARLC